MNDEEDEDDDRFYNPAGRRLKFLRMDKAFVSAMRKAILLGLEKAPEIKISFKPIDSEIE